MRFPYALAWEWLSGNVRCCTSLAVEVGMNELVKRDVYTKGDALLECLDHDSFRCVSHTCVEEHGVLGWMVVRNWERRVFMLFRDEGDLVGRMVGRIVWSGSSD